VRLLEKINQINTLAKLKTTVGRLFRRAD